MSRRDFPWHARPGLAGGIDKDGRRAAELLAYGFGSVEVGSVLPDDAAAVAARLADGMSSRWGAIGLGLGLPADLPEDLLLAASRPNHSPATAITIRSKGAIEKIV